MRVKPRKDQAKITKEKLEKLCATALQKHAEQEKSGLPIDEIKIDVSGPATDHIWTIHFDGTGIKSAAQTDVARFMESFANSLDGTLDCLTSSDDGPRLAISGKITFLRRALQQVSGPDTGLLEMHL